ncbi:non-ribosomal peptide synthetase [Streptomyces litchfieldiae]|uniref:Non-ribosomal peptide synthetase n=1 Tax=Streptomyces litchfieldiae TaxID=3075543 RepID=A0ABU2MQW7_9ACTN|nr:non-ribosomal peptide synthetase [Streptomyces sp. DSM 44938]MDT0343930.1 non-ribosomal peptide synthetase [Streptomyces sp. DSM 44938]
MSAESPASSLHGLFEERAEVCADSVAVLAGDGRHLTYRQLDMNANRLAHRLRNLGVDVDHVVGVRVDRSIDLAVSLLAVLKAGAAYLPLDPEAPAARLEQMLRDSGARVCLTLGRPPAELPGGVRGLRADDPAEVARCSPERPQVSVSPDNLVSVYYTSGSTGVPKGVASTHRGWVNRMVCMQRQHGLRPGETVVHKTTLTFDDAGLELFWPLAVGGRVAILEPGLHRDPRAIVDAVARHRAVYLQVVPSMLNLVLDTVTPQDKRLLRSLRNTTSSGEALKPATVERFRAVMPGALHNTWGATEVSIDSTHHTCVAEDTAASGAVCVGRAMADNQVHVLDENLDSVPEGQIGDLYLGGSGLARGYVNNPAATAAAFLPSPFAAGERLYATGDRGYLRPDGAVMFVGRQDHQVKIRGMRVELGEIETVLLRHPQVSEAVAVLHRSEAGLERLVAFVCPKTPADPPEPGDVQAHMAERLPDHMRPSVVLVRDSLPLNTNGKVDRGRLIPSEEEIRDHVAAGRVPCEGPVEEALAEIWCELLELPKVGALDDFFRLGAHSLLATRLKRHVSERFGVELPLHTVFERPVLRSLAAEIEKTLVTQLDSLPSDSLRRLLEDND